MSFPVAATLDNGTAVDVHLHTFFLGDRDRQCWTYITRGLAEHGQKEMSLSLLIEDDEDPDNFPRTPIKMFELLDERTRDNRKMEPGDATLLGKRGIFGFPSLFFLPAIQFPDLPTLDEHLALVLVHSEEYEYAREHGLTRLLSRLGKFCSSFPYPTWNTQIRPTLFPDSARELSLLADASHTRAGRSYIQREDDQLTLAVHPADLADLLQRVNQLGDDQLHIVCTGYSPDCDASLYWQPGQPDVGAFAAEARQTGTIGGSFFSLSIADSTGFGTVEDGFDITLNTSDWRKLQVCLADESPCEFTGSQQRICIEFLTWEPALRARAYEPRAVWHRLSASDTEQAQTTPVQEEAGSDQAPASVGKVILGSVTNLLGNNTLEENVSKPDLQAYLMQVEHTLSEALSEETNRFQFNLDILIEDGLASPTVESDASLNPAFIRFIEEIVEDILPCEVFAPIHLRLPFSVNEGDSS